MGIATTSNTSLLRDLSDQNSQGTRLGTASTDLICFYGATTAVAQSTVVVGTLSSGASASSSTGAFGYGNSTTANSIVNAIVQLKAMGLIN